MTYERAHLKAMHGYTPGQQPDTPAIKLNTNENPYPPGPAVAHALSSFPLDMLRRYPDPLAGAFRVSVARLHRSLLQTSSRPTVVMSCSDWP